MDTSSIQFYRCPVHHSKLELDGPSPPHGVVDSGVLVSPEGLRYRIERGVPNLTYPDELSAIVAQTKEEYDRVTAQVYDAGVDWQFAAVHEDENEVRELMLDMSGIQSDAQVLEVGCGTGRDSFRLARRLNERGALFMQDLSPNMVYACREKMEEHDREMSFSSDTHYFVSNGAYLPFPEGFFDVVFHFGGFNQFGDLKRSAQEFCRVTRVGGRVLYGDESVAPWLRGTEFDRIVTTNNPLFKHDLPLETIPECAREVTVRWIMGNCFYVIGFTKGEGPPPLDLDVVHAGSRGGSMRTRYFGNLEGVSVGTKRMALQAAAKAGLSMHEWLDRLVREEAERQLGAGPTLERGGDK